MMLLFILDRLEWESPWFFILILALPWVGYRMLKQSAKTLNALQYPSTRIISGSINWKIRAYQYLPYVRLLVLLLFIIALARPRWILKEEKINAEGIAIFMTMDLSSSMLSQDFDPNRLEVSKSMAVDFISKRPYDRIGLTAFSGEAFTQCPLTTDHQALEFLLKELNCGFLEDGTAIGMGLSSSINRLKEDSAKSKIIILLTDGVNNAGDISPALAAELAKLYQIKIYAIGVGTTGEAYSPIGRSPHGEYVFGMAPVNIDEALLREVTASTGGKYYRATNAEKLKEIYQEIDQLEKTRIEVRYVKRYAEEFRMFLWLALSLLGLEWFFRLYYLRLLA
ncbi:MAG TPA: VWA domain-containing protein [Saprospiraceae bacterium]|nr:VWA domain-containing protein [Saprospiraceae bacterium]